MVKADAALHRQRVAVRRDQVLAQPAQLDRVLERHQATLQRGIADGRVDEIALASASLDGRLVARVNVASSLWLLGLGSDTDDSGADDDVAVVDDGNLARGDAVHVLRELELEPVARGRDESRHTG